MTHADFSEFVARQTARSEEPTIDWQAKKVEWLGRLDALYGLVRIYLADFIANEQIAVETSSHEITEERIGTYDADKLILRIGDAIVTLTPIGTFLIAAAGRVDMKGPNATASFVLVPRGVDAPRVTINFGDAKPPKGSEPVDWEWKLLVRRPRISYLPLNETSFKDALLEVANG